jgi:Rrf2 family protein
MLKSEITTFRAVFPSEWTSIADIRFSDIGFDRCRPPGYKGISPVFPVNRRIIIASTLRKAAMLITKKNQYALRAVFELAKHYGGGPRKISVIAEIQAIPIRFLEVILAELRRGKFVESKRGPYGGYVLVAPPDQLRVGDLMRYLTRNDDTAECMAPIPETDCPYQGECAFFPFWNRVRCAIFEVYDTTTIQNLLDDEKNGGKYPITADTSAPSSW